MKTFPRWLVLSSSIVTGVTGLVYWWMDHMMTPVSEWAVINHPLQPWVLKAHIVAAPVLVFAIGLITVEHVWKHYRSRVRRGRRSGLSAMWIFVPMVLSGYLIQAVTAAPWLSLLAWLHLIAGVVYLLGIAIHQAVVRRSRDTTRPRGGTVDAGKGRGRPAAAPVPSPPEQPWSTSSAPPQRTRETV